MRIITLAVLGAGVLLAPCYGAPAPREPLDAQIDAWTECTVSSTLTMAKVPDSDEDVRSSVMRICAQHAAQLRAAAKAKYPTMTRNELKRLVQAVRRAQEQSVGIILAEMRDAEQPR